jgi:hypothetical protein
MVPVEMPCIFLFQFVMFGAAVVASITVMGRDAE